MADRTAIARLIKSEIGFATFTAGREDNNLLSRLVLITFPIVRKKTVRNLDYFGLGLVISAT